MSDNDKPPTKKRKQEHVFVFYELHRDHKRAYVTSMHVFRRWEDAMKKGARESLSERCDEMYNDEGLKGKDFEKACEELETWIDEHTFATLVELLRVLPKEDEVAMFEGNKRAEWGTRDVMRVVERCDFHA